MKRLSIVIPAFNEAFRIGYTLIYVRDYLSRQHYDFEVLVVDGGSTYVPVDWFDGRGSKVHSARTFLVVLLELLTIKCRSIAGVYGGVGRRGQSDGVRG